MAEKAQKRNNTVKVVGYLKENNLTERVYEGGTKAITGSITIAVENRNAIKLNVRIYDSSERYEEIKSLLPDNTVSIAQYIKSTPTATFDTAKEMSTKIWAIGSMEEYAYKQGEKEASYLTLRAFSIGRKETKDASSVFVPSATFCVDVVLAAIKDEVDENNNATGRLSIVGMIPGYKGITHKVDFVAPEEDNIAKYIKANYAVKDTVTLKGDLINMTVSTQTLAGSSDNFFGRSDEIQYVTKFVKEQVIRGGSKTTIHPGEAGSIDIKAIQEGLKLRTAKMEENGKALKAKKNNSTASKPATKPAAAPAAPASSGFTDDEGFDF